MNAIKTNKYKSKKMNKSESHSFRVIKVLIFLLTFTTDTICQITRTDSIKNPLEMFEGDWILKDGKWKSSFDGNARETTLSDMIISAKLIGPEYTIILSEDFGNGELAVDVWAYQKESKVVHVLSNNSYNNIGIGEGYFDENNSLRIKREFPNICETCYYMYEYIWVSLDEFEIKATAFKDDNPTGDFYGGTFIRKVD